MKRPDGSRATVIGWILIGVGVIAAFEAGSSKTSEEFWFSLAIGNLGIGVGVLLLSLGYLVRAIWFLPGRDEPQDNSSHQALQDAGQLSQDSTMCEWCGYEVASPALPCSEFGAEELANCSERANSKVCRENLEARGYLN